MKKKRKKKTTKEKTQKKVIATIKDTAPATLIQAAVAGGADLEKLKGLLDLQFRWEANEAKKAYVLAMAAFQADPPKIEKDKHVKFKTDKGMVEYNHATLANVTSKINNALSKHGLSAGWKTSQDETRISVTCKITHVMGHSEETVLKSASDLTGSKNAIQAIGSAISYLQRYTLLSLTGLATFDMDDDGKSSEQTEQKKDKIDKEKSKPEEKPPSTPANADDPSSKQKDMIAKILKSHLLLEFENFRLQKLINLGMRKKAATKYIDWWIGEKSLEHKKRQDIEKADKENGTETLKQYLGKKENNLAQRYPEDYKEFIDIITTKKGS